MDLRAMFLLLALLSASVGHAEQLDSESVEDGMIEIVYPVEATLPYRERRPKSQLTFQVQYENFAPTQFVSTAVSNNLPNTYQAVFADANIPMFNFAVGWKRNLPFVGLEASVFYGAGNIQDRRVGESIALDLHKYGAKFAVYLETLFREPYIVPYAAFQTQLWNVTETGPSLVYGRQTATVFGFQAGLLFQLNWIEPRNSLVALNDSGLNNTYLDVFVQQYGDSMDDADPRLASDMNWGLGLRLEY